jgi:hypothetical protein
MSFDGSDYYDYNKDDNLMIEPRLMEYIKKKNFYKENNIHSDVLDKQFSISQHDLIKIKNYLKNKKKDTNIHSDLVDPYNASFPSDEFKKDKRMDRIKIKQQKEIDAKEQRHDYNVISKSYDMYRNDRSFSSASGNDFSKNKINPNSWLETKNSKDELNEEFNIVPKKSFAKTNTYINPPTIYNSYLSDNTTIDNDKNTLDNIIGQLDSYSNRDKKYDKWSKKVENEQFYKPVPFMGNNSRTNELDVDVDTNMRFGMTPFRGGKSLGYKSVAEHSFSYISPDIQDPDHVVMDRGIPSRNNNKQTTRPFKRQVMM